MLGGFLGSSVDRAGLDHYASLPATRLTGRGFHPHLRKKMAYNGIESLYLNIRFVSIDSVLISSVVCQPKAIVLDILNFSRQHARRRPRTQLVTR
jgi:hypothetical protein